MRVTKKLRKELDNGTIITTATGCVYYRTNKGKWYLDLAVCNGVNMMNVIEVSARRIPESVIDMYLDSCKTQNTMIRFKTKQEFIKGKLTCSYHDSTPWGEPYNNLGGYPVGTIQDGILTLTPHPYEDKTIKMLVNSEENEEVQKKAFKLGYVWCGHGDQLIRSLDSPYLFFYGGEITRMDRDSQKYFTLHNGTELTYDEFMEGYWPEPKPKNKEATIEKLDAYMDKTGGVHVMMSNGKISTHNSIVSFRNILQDYNWMSEEDFQDKHKPPLKFRDWKVTREDNVIHVGCERLSKIDLSGFRLVMEKLEDHNVDPHEAFGWIKHNGLFF